MDKLVSVLFVLLSVLITVLFLWNEKIDFGQKINFEKLSAYFSCIGSIATATAFFYLYRQLQLQKGEHTAAYLPYIELDDLYCRFDVASKANVEGVIKIEVSLYHHISGAPVSFIYAKNTGNNSAKDIALCWRTYLKVTRFERLNRLYSRSISNVTRVQKIDNNESHEISIPRFVALHAKLALDQYRQRGEAILKIDNLYITIMYMDKMKKQYKQVISGMLKIEVNEEIKMIHLIFRD